VTSDERESRRVEISEELPAEQLLDQLGRFHFEVGGDVPKNGVKGSEANLFVCGHGARPYCRLLTINCGVGLKADATWLSAVRDRRYR